MHSYEYKVVPAPNRTKRVKGVKDAAGRFAHLLTETMNEMAADGWEYLRSDSMPVEEKPGLLKSKVENYYTVLVFRRATGAAQQTQDAGAPQVAPSPIPAPTSVPVPFPVKADPSPDTPADDGEKDADDLPDEEEVLRARDPREHPPLNREGTADEEDADRKEPRFTR